MTKSSVLLFAAIVATACGPKKTEAPQEEMPKPVETRHPEWVKTASIYEVNIRQYSPEGTLAAFEAHLPRLKELGVDILWFMPIQPIGVKNRKVLDGQELGSYYSISDYTAIHPDYGSEEDFRRIVKKAHELGLKVILDWVANHTAFDHHWTTEHPDFYTYDEKGNINVAKDNDGKLTDWTDVADLNYDNRELHQAMFEEMAWWVKEFDIDGFRCDVAGFVPNVFWNELRPKLEAIKPIFMLAEWEDTAHMKAFNMNYGWSFHHIINQVAQGKQDVSHLMTYLTEGAKNYSKDDIRMYFTTNHDENSWNGTVFERMADQHWNMFVLCATLPGMPLVYSGQEVGLDHRLSFFGKDQIDWSKGSEFTAFYKSVLAFRKAHNPLHNAAWGGDLKVLESGNPKVFIFERSLGAESVLMAFNFGSEAATLSMPEGFKTADYQTETFGRKIDLIESENGLELGGAQCVAFFK